MWHPGFDYRVTSKRLSRRLLMPSIRQTLISRRCVVRIWPVRKSDSEYLNKSRAKLYQNKDATLLCFCLKLNNCKLCKIKRNYCKEIYWCPIKLSSPIRLFILSDSRYIWMYMNFIGRKNPLESLNWAYMESLSLNNHTEEQRFLSDSRQNY